MDAFGIVSAQRGLVDPKPDVRAAATQAIASRCVALFKDVAFDRACVLVSQQCDVVDTQFVKVASPAYRRGGLLCVRALLTGLPAREYPAALVARFCELVLPSVCDVDLSVRLAAAEACHELVQCFNFQVLQSHLRELFAAMARLVSDPDRKIALIGQEVSATAREYVCGSESFHVDAALFVAFVVATLQPVGHDHLGAATLSATEVAVSLWLLSWTKHVSSLTGAPLLPFTDVLVGTLLPLTHFAPLLDDVYALLRGLVDAFMAALTQVRPSTLPALPVETVVTALCRGADAAQSTAEARVFCLEWLHAIVAMPTCGDGVAARHAPALLSVAMHQMSEANPLPRTHAGMLLDALSQAIANSDSVSPLLTELVRTLDTFLHPAATQDSPTDLQMACLKWVALLHRVAVNLDRVDATHVLVGGALEMLCGTASSAVVEAATAALDALVAPIDRLDLVTRLMAKMQRDPHRLLPRLPQIAVVMHADAVAAATDLFFQWPAEDKEQVVVVPREACVLMAFAHALRSCDDLRFVSKTVMTLNGALLTFPEFADTRDVLRAPSQSALFAQMLPTWRFHAVSLLALALLSGHDDSALAVTRVMGAVELSPVTLLQLDRLVQLLESPVFIPLRSRLARADVSPALLRALFGIVMILPQTSPQYAALRERCSVASAIRQWSETPPPPATSAAAASPLSSDVEQALEEALQALGAQEQQQQH